MGEQLIPNLTLKNEENITLGKYALMRKHYLKEHRPIQFTNLLTTQTLNQHLMEIDQTATQRHDLMLQQMMKQQGVNEALKESDPMKWVQKLNSIEETIHEILRKELIYD
ncbi:TnpV protein [Amedibacterium intestinale]|uniref:TnpV protein n=1 Tax=Amedibacterium intestinale TaxID=2583452 RepID=UPI001F043C21|nr:TnpV protein [Amedibacterium intestinale]